MSETLVSDLYAWLLLNVDTTRIKVLILEMTEYVTEEQETEPRGLVECSEGGVKWRILYGRVRPGEWRPRKVYSAV